MAVTAAGSGTQSASIGTEHTLLDVSTAGLYQLVVDAVNMADGDVLELRAYHMVLTGGTRRVAHFRGDFDDLQDDDLVKLAPLVGNELTDSGSLRFTLKQAFGTGRDFPWKVLQLL